MKTTSEWHAYLKVRKVVVHFVKADGTDRLMLCTRCLDYMPDLGPFKRTGAFSDERDIAETEGVVRVWDLMANGWRSFKTDSVKSMGIYDESTWLK